MQRGKDPAVGKDSPRTSSQVKGNKCQKFQVTFFQTGDSTQGPGSLVCLCFIPVSGECYAVVSNTSVQTDCAKEIKLKKCRVFYFYFQDAVNGKKTFLLQKKYSVSRKSRRSNISGELAGKNCVNIILKYFTKTEFLNQISLQRELEFSP